MQYTLNKEQSKEIEALLLDLLVRAEAEAVFLCDRGGNIITQNTTEQYQHEENIAALAAGSFYATRELARLIGEPVFRYIFHRGDKTSIYMQNTIKDMLLLVVFGRQSNPGLVKLYADDCCRSFETISNSLDFAKQGGQAGTPAMEIQIDDTKEPFKRVPRADSS